VTSCLFTISLPVQLSITTTSLPAGMQNTAYSATVAAAGGKTPYTWSISNPAWLTINPSTGVISGTPNRGAGNFTVSVTVTDSSSTQVSHEFHARDRSNPLVFNTTTLPNANAGQF